MPKLSNLTEKLPAPRDLAFWKKESSSVPPPPPAQHLNPSSTKGLSELADLGQRNGIDIDDYRRKVDQMSDGIASASEGLGSQQGFGSQQPLRAPYGEGTFNSDLKSASNRIDGGLAAATEKAKTFGSKAQNLGSSTLSDAQNRFNAAIADVKKPLGDNGFRAPKDILSTTPSNDFKKALADTGSQLKTGIESGINTARNNINLDANAGKINNSLYDMHGNLTSGASNASKSLTSSVDAARQRFGSALGTVSDKAIEAAKTSTEFGGNLKDKIVSAASELQPPLRGGDNSFKPAFNKTVEPLANKARNLIDNAKKDVAALGTGFDFPQPQAPSAPQPKAPQPPQTQAPAATFSAPSNNQFGGNVATAAPSPKTETFGGGSFGGGTFNRTRVANVTPANIPQGGTLTRPQGLDSSLTKSWNNGSRQSNLKAIEVGTGSSTPGNALRTVSTASNDFSAGVGTIPAAFDEGRNATTGYINDVDIPSKILTGSGSYAPGSVNKVR